MGIDSYNSTVKMRLANAPKTRILQLKDSALRKFPQEIEQFSNVLRNLDLSDNYVDELPQWIGKFTQLKQFNMSRNLLDAITDEIGTLDKLETFIVQNNKLLSTPKSLANCVSLKTVDFSNNWLTEFPLGLCSFSLTNLETVNLSGNRIEQIPNEIEEFKAITLSLTKNRLRTINSDKIVKCQRIKVLQLDENQLSRFEIESLLEEAPKTWKITSQNNLSKAEDKAEDMGNDSSKPRSSAGSGGLKKIIGKSGPSTSTVNKHLEMASKSRILQLKGSGLKKVPEEVEQLAEIIRTLDLSENKIREIPSFIGGFSQLKQLHFSNNVLESLPDEIGQMKKLEILNLGGNKLKTLPDTIAGCTDLRSIDLSSNEFAVFPRALFCVMQIDFVNLNSNCIEELPDEIGDLKAIELSLNQNRLRSLNATKLIECPRLRSLRVEENCLAKTEFTRELLEKSQISLIAFNGNLFQDREFQDLNGYEAYQDRYTATRRKM
ncbi:unnamed protein product [Caenorhabditis auriculariae]|uniref:Disease resistance R13L4/SHOC-2-like LRR domain-containing protein n=1 Tax=Caenorhabditis auriculariae TaxID=2777116 RepID=A0A8S1HD38_9PELO|nr:unnamed protein product [Caenorhabditis auriculariae]